MHQSLDVIPPLTVLKFIADLVEHTGLVVASDLTEASSNDDAADE
jgi:hypothetical protein